MAEQESGARPHRDERSSTAELRRAVLLAVLLAVGLVLFDVVRESTSPLNLIQPGLDGPSAEVFRQDFPEDFELIPDSSGLDGQQFYVIARNPFDLGEASPYLDRPRYRFRRPLLSWLAWLGHPTGGGPGLVASFFVVGIASVALLATAVGTIAVRLGGPAWTAGMVGLFPGVWWSLRVSVADTLAAGLGLGVIALLLHGRTRTAVLAACGAVLAKETAAIILVGWLLADWRDRRRWYPVLAAGIVGVGWWIYLSIRLPGTETIGELTAPLTGVIGAVRDRWLEGDELWGLLGTATAVIATIAGLIRSGIRHPLGPAILLQLAFLSLGNADVIGNDYGGARSTLPLLALAVITFATPEAALRKARSLPVEVNASG